MKTTLTTLALTLCIGLSLAQSNKYAFVDTDYVMSRMPEAEEMNARVAETQKSLQADYEKKRQQMQELYQQYVANQSTLPDSVKAKTADAINALNNELQQFPAEAEKAIRNTQNLYLATIYLKVGKAIEAVAAENGYTMIFPVTISQQAFLLYADPAFNVSNLVLAQLGIAVQSASEKK